MAVRRPMRLDVAYAPDQLRGYRAPLVAADADGFFGLYAYSSNRIVLGHFIADGTFDWSAAPAEVNTATWTYFSSGDAGGIIDHSPDGAGGVYVALTNIGWTATPFYFTTTFRVSRYDVDGALTWTRDMTVDSTITIEAASGATGVDRVPGTGQVFAAGWGRGNAIIEDTYPLGYTPVTTSNDDMWRRFVAELDPGDGTVVWLVNVDDDETWSAPEFTAFAATDSGAYAAGELNADGDTGILHFAAADGTMTTVVSWSDGTIVYDLTRAADGTVYALTAPAGTPASGLTLLMLDGGAVTGTLGIDGMDRPCTVSSFPDGQWVVGGSITRTSPAADHAVICGGTWAREEFREEAMHDNPSDDEAWFSRVTSVSSVVDGAAVLGLHVGDSTAGYTAADVEFVNGTFTSTTSNDYSYLCRVLWLPSFIRQRQSPRACTARLSTWSR